MVGVIELLPTAGSFYRSRSRSPSPNYCYKLEFKDPRLSFTQTGDQPDLDPSSSPGDRHNNPDYGRPRGGTLQSRYLLDRSV
ncbi:hypothetical protein J6590_026568 [Homalodisca vitripennis]|nr:hypothetical protein J6590_026568 [Homalodisca vitripennis]